MKTLYTFILAITALSASAKPYPQGAGVVCPVRDANLANESWTDSSGTKHLYWTDPECQFVVIRDNWSSAEPSDGVFDWSYLDQGLALAKQYNKPIVISVSGAVYPQWIATEGVPIWTSSLNGNSCPYPWNATLQAKWGALVSAMGARYDSHGLVHAVTMWAGGTGIECFFARNATDDTTLDAIAGNGPGSGAALWENAAKALINFYYQAFPTTAAYLACGENYWGDGKASMTDLAHWFLTRYFGPGSLQSNAVNSTYPYYDNSLGYWPFPHTTIDCASIAPLIMYQYLDPLANKNMNGATNMQVMGNGYSGGAGAIQYYPADPGTDNEAGAVWFNDKFGL